MQQNKQVFVCMSTVFENQRKSLIQQCELSKLRYVYILSGQKFIKNAKNGQFGEFLEIRSLRLNSVTRQVNFNM